MNVDLYSKLLRVIIRQIQSDATADFAGDSEIRKARRKGTEVASRECWDAHTANELYNLLRSKREIVGVMSMDDNSGFNATSELVEREEALRFVEHVAECMSAFLVANGLRPITPEIKPEHAIEMVAAMQTICADKDLDVHHKTT